jgi:hypothetical protein
VGARVSLGDGDSGLTESRYHVASFGEQGDEQATAKPAHCFAISHDTALGLKRGVGVVFWAVDLDGVLPQLPSQINLSADFCSIDELRSHSQAGNLAPGIVGSFVHKTVLLIATMTPDAAKSKDLVSVKYCALTLRSFRPVCFPFLYCC